MAESTTSDVFESFAMGTGWVWCSRRRYIPNWSHEMSSADPGMVIELLVSFQWAVLILDAE